MNQPARPKRPVLFLDIDGVLNRHERHPDSGYYGTHPDCVAFFNRIVRALDPVIVLSSAWRYVILNGDMTLPGVEFLLMTHGVDAFERIIDVTDSDEVSQHHRADDPEDRYDRGLLLRKRQILRWAEIDGGDSPWLAIDNLPLDLPDPHFLFIDEMFGMAEADAYRALDLALRQRPDGLTTAEREWVVVAGARISGEFPAPERRSFAVNIDIDFDKLVGLGLLASGSYEATPKGLEWAWYYSKSRSGRPLRHADHAHNEPPRRRRPVRR